MEYLTPAIIIAIIIGVAEAIKKMGCPKRFIPLIDIALGVVGGVFVFGIYLGHGITEGVVIGLVMGLSACGLFSGVKNTLEKK